MRNKWCKLHNDIRHNYKLNTVSHEDRWAYFCYLTLETDGTLDKGAPDAFLAGELRLSLPEFLATRRRMIEAGLLDANGRVKNFHKRQYTPDAERKQAERDRKKSHGQKPVTNPVTVTRTCHASEAEADTESDSDAEADRAGERARATSRGANLTPTMPASLLPYADELPEVDPNAPPSSKQLLMLAGKARGCGTTLRASCASRGIPRIAAIHVDQLLAELRPVPADPKVAESEVAKAKRAARKFSEQSVRMAFADRGPAAARAAVESAPAHLRTELGFLVESLESQAVQP